MKITPPDLASMFARFQQLSMFWDRTNTPTNLRYSEMQEYLSLSQSIPEMIRRLTAFADLGAGQMASRYWAARKLQPETGADAGQEMPYNAYYLQAGEVVHPSDEYKSRATETWHPTIGAGFRVELDDVGRYRRLATPAKDTVGGNGAEMGTNAPETAIAAQEQPSKEVWRMLAKGEIIQSGDQYEDEDLGWIDTNIVGLKFSGMFLPHRRRVSPSPEPKLP